MLYFIALLTLLLHLAYGGARVTMSLFALHLGASAAAVGVMISLLAVVPILFSVKWGRYIDRVGVRGPMYAGLTALLAALLIAVAVPRLEALFIVATLAGSGFMIFHIAVHQAAALIGNAEDRSRNFSVIALAFSTSGFLGPMIAGFSIDLIGHTYTFLLFAVVLVVMLLIMAARTIDVPRHATALKPGEHKRITDLFRIPELRRVLVMSAILSMAWDLFTFVMPIHGSNLGLTATAIGLILGCFGAAVLAVRLVLPLFVHRVSEMKVLVWAMFVTGAALALIPVVQDPRLLMALAILLGIGLGCAQPMILTLVYNKAPSGRGGEAIGVRTLLLNFAQAGIPLTFGALGAALGMAPVFWLMAFVLAGGAWYAGRGR